MIDRAGRAFGTYSALAGHIAVLLLAGLIGAAPLSANPVETLAAADKELKSGNHELSITHADNAIASGKLAPAELARALYIRGSSYLAAGKSSQAIVDLNAALWMKKLPPRLENDAKTKRYQAYTGAGVAPRAAVATRPVRTQRTISRSAPPSKPAATGTGIAQGSHKVALPVERQTGLPEGTRTRPRILNSRAPEARPKTILAPLPVTQTTPKWTSTTRQVARPPNVQGRTPAAPASRPLNAAVPAATTAPLVKPRRQPAGSIASTRQPATSTSNAAVGPFTTQTNVARRPASVVRRPAPPLRTAPRPAATPDVAAVRPATTAPPYASPARPAPAPSFGVRDGLYEDTPRAPAPGTAATTDSSGGTSFFGSLIGGSEPKSEALTAADELQRRRTEQIRAHNRRIAGEE